MTLGRDLQNELVKPNYNTSKIIKNNDVGKQGMVGMVFCDRMFLFFI
jgi:hypothetical protein